MKKILILISVSSLFLISCSKVRESAGVNRKSIDEFTVIDNPPLVIPPDFNLLPPEQLEEKNLDNAESDLAEEILFGLENETNAENSKSSTMEKKLQSKSWDDEIEILDSITESERIRNNLLKVESESNEEIPKIKIKNPGKKKKRFFFF